MQKWWVKAWQQKGNIAYIALQKLSVETYHIGERLVLIGTNLKLCKVCVFLTTSQRTSLIT